jgi:hypothetical protein
MRLSIQPTRKRVPRPIWRTAVLIMDISLQDAAANLCPRRNLRIADECSVADSVASAAGSRRLTRDAVTLIATRRGTGQIDTSPRASTTESTSPVPGGSIVPSVSPTDLQSSRQHLWEWIPADNAEAEFVVSGQRETRKWRASRQLMQSIDHVVVTAFESRINPGCLKYI